APPRPHPPSPTRRSSDLSDKRYRLTNTPGTSVSVTAAATITGSYVTQYQVSFAQSGIGTDTGANTVVTVGGTTFTKIDLTDTRFWDDGTAWSFSSPVATSPASDKQYRLTNTAGGTLGAADAGTTITGAYNTQWKVTFAQTGIP